MTLPKIITDRFGTQADAMRSLALAFIIGLTFSLAWLNVGGAWASSGNLALTFCILFAEFLAAICMGLIILARTWPRKLVGALIFAALVWVCLENGLAAIKLSFSDVFVADSQTLRDRSALAGEEAAQLQAAATNAVSSTGGELDRVRDSIAKVELEQKLMASQSPEKIKEAQSLLLAQGKYYGSVDGVRSVLTEGATRARGEELASELATLKQRETGMMSGAAPPAVTATSAKKLDQIELDAAARAVSEKLLWAYFLLFGLEGARSFGVWAFLMNATSRNETRRQELLDDIAHADLEAQLARARAGIGPGQNPIEIERQEATPVTTKADVTPTETVTPPVIDTPIPVIDTPILAEPEPDPVIEPPVTVEEPLVLSDPEPLPVEEIAPEATTTETVTPSVIDTPIPEPELVLDAPVEEPPVEEAPVEAITEPVEELEPLPGPPEPPVQGRKGGLATQFYDRAENDPAKIPVDDWAARDGHIDEEEAA